MISRTLRTWARFAGIGFVRVRRIGHPDGRAPGVVLAEYRDPSTLAWTTGAVRRGGPKDTRFLALTLERLRAALAA